MAFLSFARRCAVSIFIPARVGICCTACTSSPGSALFARVRSLLARISTLPGDGECMRVRDFDDQWPPRPTATVYASFINQHKQKGAPGRHSNLHSSLRILESSVCLLFDSGDDALMEDVAAVSFSFELALNSLPPPHRALSSLMIRSCVLASFFCCLHLSDDG